ncbi:MAG: crossover junction endodeoxyribonuclease RuvC, partial [Gemmatimonadales bacterium]
MKVLGVDPGTSVTGYGVIETGNGAPGFGRLVECGVIPLSRRGPLPRRLQELHAGIAELIRRHHPTALALENAFYHRNVRTTLVLGYARGVVLLAAQQAGLDIAEYPPATVKKTVVGRGGARKGQVAAMVARLLRLRQAPRPTDAAD